jgi:hypothetical protein
MDPCQYLCTNAKMQLIEVPMLYTVYNDFDKKDTPLLWPCS